jgi:glycerophosphoryl diester phosphodiesterase
MANFDTSQPAQMLGVGGSGYTVDPVFTIGDSVNGYTPPGIPDGMGAYALDEQTVRILVNHELNSDTGYAYTLANGTQLTGARVSYFDIDKATRTIVDAGLAYDTIYNRAGEIVDEATDLEFEGIDRLCSAQYIPANQFGAGIGLEDGLFFTGEETDGGTEFVVNPVTKTLYAVPWMGRAAWESVTELNTGTTDKVAILVGDDRGAAPLLLYIGEKNAIGDGSLLDRNGLAQGKLYVWVASNGDVDPSQFKGTFESREGSFVEIDYYRPDLAGNGEYDKLGFATQEKQDALAAAAGAFQFSRPEDVSTNPADGTQAVMASTGRGQLFGGADNWGTTYKIEVDLDDLSNISARLDILYDGDDAGAGQFAGPDFGLRSPDNLDWADDGYIYIQEDRSTLSSLGAFGDTSGEEASIWKLDPNTGELTRIAQINRNTGVPEGQTDGAIGDIGNWESSGILDVSTLFDQAPGSLFIANTQAHSLRDGIIAEENLVQGGQIFFVSGPAELEGFASLPADTFAEGPPTGEGISGNGRTGPFEGPPVQGFSGVQFAPGGDGSTFWFLSDNGFGSKANSPDYLLRLYQADPNFAGSENGDSSVEIQGFVQLSDPNNLIPFEIQNESTTERHLTGSDFDIESFVIDGNGDIWIGEEFGPYILHFDATGKLLEAPIPTPNITNLKTLNGQDPIVIGHRGASGSRPEHTLEAYQLAIELGADFIEPDLVVTKDGVLVARHENEISGTTDVADRPEFADRKTTKVIDGAEFTGWFIEDFTLAELKTLRAKERIPGIRPDNTQFDGQFEVPTLKEVIDLVKQIEADTGKVIGIYPETKHPTFLAKEGKFLDGTPINLDTSQILVDTLIVEGFTDPNRIFIQSFEFQNLIEIQARLDVEGLGDIPLVQLYGDTTTGANPENAFSFPYDIRYNVAQGNNLAEIYGQAFLDAAENPLSENTVYADLDNPTMLQVMRDLYAEGAGPWKNNFLLREALDTPVDGNGDGVAEITTQLTGEVTSFVDNAHAAGLQVHPYTHRNEERYLTLNPNGTPQTPESELAQLISIGVDGFFTDFPGTGDAVRDQVVADFVRSPDNPGVLAGNEVSNLSRSRGYEGMAFSPDRKTLYPMLEGTVIGDPAGSLRIYEFDVSSSAFEDLVRFYQMEAPNHAIGDFTPINEHEFLVIERDGGQAAGAEFKKIFKVDLSEVNADGFVKKEELVDLLNIGDPNDLNGDGKTTFDFPFVTIEDVLVLDKDTILVANDNNYPFSIGRDFSGQEIDNNEVIQIKLNQSLNLDPRLGVAGLAVESEAVVGTEDSETIAGDLGNQTIFGQGGDDILRGDLNNRSAQVGIGGDDIIYGGDGNDRIGGKGGNDHLFGDAGHDSIWGDDGDDLLRGGLGNDILTGDDFSGGSGRDTFVLAAGEGTDTILDFQVGTDFIGLADGLTFGDLSIGQSGSTAVINLGDENLAFLNGVNATDLTADAFVIV